MKQRATPSDALPQTCRVRLRPRCASMSVSTGPGKLCSHHSGRRAVPVGSYDAPPRHPEPSRSAAVRSASDHGPSSAHPIRRIPDYCGFTATDRDPRQSIPRLAVDARADSALSSTDPGGVRVHVTVVRSFDCPAVYTPLAADPGRTSAQCYPPADPQKARETELGSGDGLQPKARTCWGYIRPCAQRREKSRGPLLPGERRPAAGGRAWVGSTLATPSGWHAAFGDVALKVLMHYEYEAKS